MQISITGRHLHISEEAKQLIEERCQKFLHYFHRLTSVQVTASLEQEEVAVEFVIHAIRGVTFAVRDRDSDLHVAADRAASKVERRLVKLKEKIKERRPGKVGAPGEQGAAEYEESYEGSIQDFLNEEE